MNLKRDDTGNLEGLPTGNEVEDKNTVCKISLPCSYLNTVRLSCINLRSIIICAALNAAGSILPSHFRAKSSETSFTFRTKMQSSADPDPTLRSGPTL